jgi:uncharacterized protein YbjT (DUF2867 family)
MRIAVAGGTGTVGRPLVEALGAAGHEPIVLARSTGVDLVTGEGLDGTLSDVAAVVDVTSVAGASAEKSVAFFGAVTRTLLAAEKAAGVPHHVALSIVGAARIGLSYYAGKKAQEELVMAAPNGWTLVRATQFHEFVRSVYEIGKVGPLLFAPSMILQPIAAAEVGAALAEIATGAPRGLDADLAGPRKERMVTMIGRYARSLGQKRPVIQIPVPGAWGRAMRDGSLLPADGARLGTQTFDEWLG